MGFLGLIRSFLYKLLCLYFDLLKLFKQAKAEECKVHENKHSVTIKDDLLGEFEIPCVKMFGECTILDDSLKLGIIEKGAIGNKQTIIVGLFNKSKEIIVKNSIHTYKYKITVEREVIEDEDRDE